MLCYIYVFCFFVDVSVFFVCLCFFVFLCLFVAASLFFVGVLVLVVLVADNDAVVVLFSVGDDAVDFGSGNVHSH